MDITQYLFFGLFIIGVPVMFVRHVIHRMKQDDTPDDHPTFI